ncbi:tripartite tricarboxylate transporter substrate binding protein [Paracoccus sp. Z118]|uniref:Bug family tripartite tricarboxylate transporter substrate binding protein n=1 Tax=Paracoccus sp. Z118 TaxID=2851017 RepID=UPI001C2B8619|nr:tripartite tricarboxylate transporter substrate binding protein [Paracoccus sp. Z118]
MNARTTLLSLAAGAMLAWPVAAVAQDYPDRPVSVMVSYGAGGATDFQARVVTMVSGEEDYLGQSMVIVNKPGAGGRVGWNWFVRQAPADGYTLAVYNMPHFLAQAVEGGVQFDIDSFEPIANWGADPAVVIVGKDSPFNTIEEFVTYAKENPGKLTVSGAGLFVGHHIALLQMEQAADIDLAYIPSQGGGSAAMTAVIAGNVMAGINNLSDAYRGMKAGDIKVLAVADLERSAEFMPDVPTLMERGIDVDDTSVNFRGLMAPKGTPPEVIEVLAEKVPAMFNEPRVAEQLKAGGAEVRVMGRDEVREMWDASRGELEKVLEGL